ncbi:MAG TPA: LPS assembly lipoprotein LptE [Gemmatimonadaceae bacterium]|nr:LPS assembly lipoprotein LptE [Gemmatimonadaceae bacterium]
MRRPGASLLLPCVALLTACIYGFAGGGLPSHIKTVAVLPFDNQTTASGLQSEIYDQLTHDIQGRLGLRPASEGKADAVVRGTITRYEADIPVGYSANPNQAVTSARRKLQITVDVEIVDQTTGRTLWTRKGLIAEGEYAERSEDDGRTAAVQKLVDDVIDGAQSQW